MTVLEKLEARFRKLDTEIKQSLHTSQYAFRASEEREILDLAMRYIRGLEQQLEQYNAFVR